MSTRTVLVTDYTWPSTDVEADVLAAVGATLLLAGTGEEDELVELVEQADAILTCFAPVTERVIRAGRRLEVIARYGIGVDNIDVAAATQLGILVTNVPAYCLDEVAEHTLALLLSLARKIVFYDRAIREGDWSLGRGRPIYRVRGRILGIVGFGKIGRRVAERAHGFGLRVIVHDPVAPPDLIEEAGAQSVSLEDLAAQADFVTVHVPLSDATRGLIDERILRAMKPSAFILNTARGGVVDQAALERALVEEWIAGAGIDVFEPERLPADHALLGAAGLVATPHVAFYSEESVVDLETLAAESVAAVLSGRRPADVVNPSVLELPRWTHLT